MWRGFEVSPAFLPALVLLFFTGWAGTFAGAARGAWPMVGHGILLLSLIFVGRWWRDPLGLGRAGTLLPLALVGSLAASWYLSPVPRAGLLGLFLAPLIALLPRVVRVCWQTPERRRLGVLAVTCVVAGVAGGSLLSGAWLDGDPAALPLGHHNLLAAWLVTLLPIALAPWRDGGAGRLLAGLAGGLGLLALAATRSLSAALTVAVLAAVLAAGRRRGRLALGVAVALLVLQIPRLSSFASSDGSLRARLGYLEAGGRGVLERPVFGWGPGATAWTVSEHLRPVPGIHPPGEVVADLHALPLGLAYELGISGVLLVLGVVLVFVRRRRIEAGAGVDAGLSGAALVGMAGFAIMSCGGMPLSVTALPVALAIVMGALWAASGGAGETPALPADAGETPALPADAGETPALPAAAPLLPADAGETPALPAAAPALPAPAVVAVGVAVTVIFAGPLHLARLAYDRAVVQDDAEEQARYLRRAVALDPAFPLYRARLAWLDRELAGAPDPELARRALRAAGDAYAIAPLWLIAGLMAQETREPWSSEALVRACRLDPLGALAPYRLATGEDHPPRAVDQGARALLSDPDLLAAAWDGRYELLAAAVERAAGIDGIDAGWRLRLRETFERGLTYSGEVRRKGLELDADPATSLSLHAFRRTPWPAALAPVELDLGALGQLDLVSMARQPSTASDVFAFRAGCALSESPAGAAP